MIIDSAVVTGSFIVSGGLYVSGNSTFGGNALVQGDLYVGGTLIGTASYAATASYAKISGSSSVTGTLYISGGSTVIGDSTFTGSVSITGSTFISGSTQFTGSTTFLGTQTVSGSVSVSGTVTATSFTGSLDGTASWAITASYALDGGDISILGGGFRTTYGQTLVGGYFINGNTSTTLTSWTLPGSGTYEVTYVATPFLSGTNVNFRISASQGGVNIPNGEYIIYSGSQASHEGRYINFYARYRFTTTGSNMNLTVSMGNYCTGCQRVGFNSSILGGGAYVSYEKIV